MGKEDMKFFSDLVIPVCCRIAAVQVA